MPEDEGELYNKSNSESNNGFHCNTVNQGAGKGSGFDHDPSPKSYCYKASQQNGETAVGLGPEAQAILGTSSSPYSATAQGPRSEGVRQGPNNPFTARNDPISSSKALPPLDLVGLAYSVLAATDRVTTQSAPPLPTTQRKSSSSSISLAEEQSLSRAKADISETTSATQPDGTTQCPILPPSTPSHPLHPQLLSGQQEDTTNPQRPKDGIYASIVEFVD